jgi:DNA-binding transcriptional LysR family regulator
MAVDLHHIRHFLAVAEELHFGRAALRLGMAQPPLSQSIKRLEAELGFALFERTQRRVMLTPAGEVFLREARRTLAQADEAVRIARRAASEATAELAVTFVSAALYRLLPETLRRFRKSFPNVAIKLDERPSDAQLTDLVEGKVDLGFIHPPVPHDPNLKVETIHRDILLLAVPQHDPLSSDTPVRLSDLSGRSFVLFPYVQGPVLHTRITEVCRRAGFFPDIAQEARQMHTILSLVAAGFGVSLVPAGATSMRVADVRFVEVADLPRDLAWELAIARRARDSKKALRDFIAVVREVAAE